MERIIEHFFTDIEPLFMEVDGVVYAPAIELISASLEASVALVVIGAVVGFLVFEPLSLLGCFVTSYFRKHLESRKKFGVTDK